ncbi:hypothetical protein [Lutimaribacter saemankumensis]|uniref:hypothetical protein n=1 Tax=Lutimaribacter saemankumensis TaxID=490829 RepID=UPI001FDEEED9|nr:hypothetical protein [Lutimaribacter saemankumensis]
MVVTTVGFGAAFSADAIAADLAAVAAAAVSLPGFAAFGAVAFFDVVAVGFAAVLRVVLRLAVVFVEALRVVAGLVAVLRVVVAIEKLPCNCFCSGDTLTGKHCLLYPSVEDCAAA